MSRRIKTRNKILEKIKRRSMTRKKSSVITAKSSGIMHETAGMVTEPRTGQRRMRAFILQRKKTLMKRLSC